MSKFICECGQEFENGQSFNGHKAHCKVHQLSKYGNLDKLTKHYLDCTTTARSKGATKIAIKIADKKKKRIEEETLKLSQWIDEQHVCEKCGKVMTTKFGSGRFCSRSCANSKIQTQESNAKRSATLKLTFGTVHTCKYCGSILDSSYSSQSKVCRSCKQLYTHEKLVNAGKKAAATRVVRSKSEIYFCELCENCFKNVRHNEPIFNGWDADVIIDDIKYAVLWNGPWHFRKVMDGVSLLQIQTRDKIKCDEIRNFGYMPYIIEDDHKFSKKHVEKVFDRFIEDINKNDS